MLQSKNLNDKTYEELIEEAVSKIPLYSQEWTNYNASDPGITILENLAAFQVVQRQQLNTVTELHKEKLLKLTGILPKPEQVSRVLLKAPQSQIGRQLLAGEKFISGETCFEAERSQKIPGSIIGIFTEYQEEYCDVTEQLCGHLPVSTMLFGEQPKEKSSVYFVIDRLPKESQQQLHFYVEVLELFPRNPWEETGDLWFAKTQWSIYTKDTESGDGYTTVAKVQDDTSAFLQSGEIMLKLGDCVPVWSRDLPKEGYVIRCQLTKANYDIGPRVNKIHGLLFPVYQRNTMAAVRSYSGEADIEIHNTYLGEHRLFVYGKELGEDGYCLYRHGTAETTEPGYCYELEEQEHNTQRLLFKKQPHEVRIVSCCEEFMPNWKLDCIYGYEQQTMKLYGVPQAEVASLMLMTEQREEAGNLRYHFFRQEEQGEGSLYYTYSSQKQEIQIWDFGSYEGAQVYVCAVASFWGEEGNARKDNKFQLWKHPFGDWYTNPADGKGGRRRESIRDMEKRLMQELHTPGCAVTTADYERLVKQIPGLCIHKVRAVFESQKNVVTVMVKPYSRDKFPKLSKQYQQMIYYYLEKSRMLTVCLTIKGPVYVPIDVRAVIFVKKHYENGEEEIRRLLNQELDVVSDDREFGAAIYFNEVYQKIKDLPCVEYLEELIFTPTLGQEVLIDGLNIHMKENALCCPGKMNLEISKNYIRQ